MQNKKFFFVLAFILAASMYPTLGKAQEYKGAVGGRFGYGIGLTGVYMLNQRSGHGLEFLLRYGYHGLVLNRPGANMQVLYEKHWEFRRNSNWTGYIGGGPALGFGKLTALSKDVYCAMGLSPIVGIDYTTQQLRVPLILAFDYKPGFYVDVPISKYTTNKKATTDISFYEIAFSVRIVIK